MNLIISKLEVKLGLVTQKLYNKKQDNVILCSQYLGEACSFTSYRNLRLPCHVQRPYLKLLFFVCSKLRLQHDIRCRNIVEGVDRHVGYCGSASVSSVKLSWFVVQRFHWLVVERSFTKRMWKRCWKRNENFTVCMILQYLTFVNVVKVRLPWYGVC